MELGKKKGVERRRWPAVARAPAHNNLTVVVLVVVVVVCHGSYL
jgi:hypothetical protein